MLAAHLGALRLESHFSPAMLELAHEGQQPLQAVGYLGPRKGRVHLLDAVGCRSNSIFQCEHIPVFCPLDELRSVDLSVERRSWSSASRSSST